MASTLSRRAYAKRRGCNESAVRRAIREGRITLAPDGRIDPLEADREWRERTDPARSYQAQAAAKRVKVYSDFGDNIRMELETEIAERLEYSPEKEASTLERIADVHRVPPAIVLDWLRAGLPYIRTGDWETGVGFVLHYDWTWRWLHAMAAALNVHGEEHLLRRLRLKPYLNLDYTPADHA